MNGLEVDGLRVTYTEAGSPSNPPVILIHGIMSHCGVWTRTVEDLKNNFHCIAIDQIGFGHSDKPKNGDYTVAKQAERALKVADHFGFEKFTLIGHSMGGQVSTYLTANLAPQRVTKLISVDGVVTGRLSFQAETITRRMVALVEKFPALSTFSLRLCNQSKFLAYSVFGLWFYKISELSFDSWRVDRQMALNPEIAHVTPKAWDSLNATNLTPMLKKITAPTLVIFGNQDNTVPVSHAHVFKREQPAAQLVLLDRCGHFPMYEKFDEYIKPLRDFLLK
jgi:pimeloyl-ACP methyl ester carboxylesterase